jgi:NAD(P)-dependent dehydrogenase (short-subunit alcohol dehydrogenase family)
VTDRTPDRAVLITGASSGIGRATAHAFARDGARLMLVARGADALDAVARECRDLGATSAHTAVVDFADAEGGTMAVDAAMERLGRLDVVVHSATVMAYGSIEELPAAVFERVVDVGINGTARMARAALPVMRAQGAGTFVVINSLLGKITTPLMGAYITAKWGQRGLVRVLQQEVRDAPGVHVCMIAPGATNTPIYLQAANITGRVPRPPIPVDSPEKLAAAVLKTVDHPRRIRSVGLANWLTAVGFTVLPGVYDVLVGPLVKAGALSRDQAKTSDGNVFEPHSADDSTHGKWRQVR